MKLNTIVLSVAAVLCSSILFIGCGGGASGSNNSAVNKGNTTTAANTTTPSNTTVVSTNTAPAGDSVGVPECDEYIKKYEACLTSIAAKNPQVEGPMKTAFEAQRSGFKAAAATPQGKATLATTCKQAIETAKSSTTAYSCAW